MIRLTLKSNGNPLYIAPENITAICDNNEGGAEVYSGHDFSLVRETAAEVARKVLEWKLEMERYKAAAIVALTHRANENNPYMPPLDAQRELEILAGLEEPNHD